jgi:dCMP deaminase
MKSKFIELYCDIAQRVADLSSARRLKCGAIIVKDDRIISIGYNGMPSGWDNNCEHEEWNTETGTNELRTRPEVLHAETNAIAKLAKSTESGHGADIFITHSPCIQCAKLIYQSGIHRVYFGQHYRLNDGVQFLKQSNIQVIQTGE